MAGLKKRPIARLTGLDRETVSRILSMTEIGMLRAEGRSMIISAIPELTRRFLNIAQGFAEKGDLDALLAALRGVQVLTNKIEVEDTTDAEQRNYAYPKIAFFHKYGRWPSLEESKEFDKTIPVEPIIKESARGRSHE
jgi:hypothetical protein